MSGRPADVTICEIAKDPAAYDRKRIRLGGVISFAFEGFGISDLNCDLPSKLHFGVWITYAGTLNSGAVYCCPGEGVPRSEPAKIDDTEVPLIDDSQFKSFKALLARERDTTVKATVVGVFLSGENTVNPDGSTSWTGYGHFGMNSLLMLQQVESFDPHDRQDIDYSATEGRGEHERFEGGCRPGSSVSSPFWGAEDPETSSLSEQRAAEDGRREWAFNDPMRVATEAAHARYPGLIKTLSVVKKSSARWVFRWHAGRRSIVIVVIRPYWLLLRAAGPSVVWTVSMITDADCR